jgi:glycogen synthase
MRILLVTPFYPMVGGIETGSELLAMEWCKAGHEVVIATTMAFNDHNARTFPFRIVYGAGLLELLLLAWKADVFVHCNIGLKSFAPALLWPRKFIATHHGIYWFDRARKRTWKEKLKLLIAKYAVNITVSRSIESEIGAKCRIIPAPYNETKFFPSGSDERLCELIFVGRLVSEKGVGIVLRALAILKASGLMPHLTIVGDGPERGSLEQLAGEFKVLGQVNFTGLVSTEKLAGLLNRHRILVVPSLYNEPFGLVAVEGIACGCVVVGSSGGGLPEAIGPCGLTFPNGDASALAQRLRQLLTDQLLVESLRASGPTHVAKHRASIVAAAYMEVFLQRVE